MSSILRNGSQYVLTFKVNGDSRFTSDGVVVTFANSAGLSILSVTGNGVWNDPDFTIGTIQKGVTEVITCNVEITDLTQDLSVTATVTTTNSESTPDNNTVTKYIRPFLEVDEGIIVLSSQDVNKKNVVVISDAFYIVQPEDHVILVDNSANSVEIIFDVLNMHDGASSLEHTVMVVGTEPIPGFDVSIAAPPGGVFHRGVELGYTFTQLGESIRLISDGFLVYLI